MIKFGTIYIPGPFFLHFWGTIFLLSYWSPWHYSNSSTGSHICQLPLLNSSTSFRFIYLSSFVSHHGKHSQEWCCLTIKAYMYILQISPWQNYRLILYYWIQADNWQADAMRLKKCILPKNIDDSHFMFLRGLNSEEWILYMFKALQHRNIM